MAHRFALCCHSGVQNKCLYDFDDLVSPRGVLNVLTAEGQFRDPKLRVGKRQNPIGEKKHYTVDRWEGGQVRSKSQN